MARNGSGTYTLPAGNPVTSGGVITDTWTNTTLSDIGTELTNSLARDGQAPATGNIPMGGNKITGLGSGTTLTDGANVGQIQSSGSQWISSISGTDTITGSVSPSLTAYAAGQTFRFVSAGANTGAVTLNINAVGAKSVTKAGATALAAGDIPSGAVAEVVYDGTRFQLIGVLASTVPVSSGGTGATTASGARTNLGLGTAAIVDTPISVANGGTGSSTASGARTNLGLGSAATLTAGTAANNVVQLDGSAKLPAVDGSQLTGLQSITLATPQATTSGTAFTFTGIPAGTKRVVVYLVGVSATTPTSSYYIRIGPSGGVATSGYSSSKAKFDGSAGTFSISTDTSAFSLGSTGTGAAIDYAKVTLELENSSSNTWVCNGISYESSTPAVTNVVGYISLSGSLTQIQLTTASGIAFDAGEVNISYE